MYQELELWKAEQAKKTKEILYLTFKSAKFLMQYHGTSTIKELGEKRNYTVIIKE